MTNIWAFSALITAACFSGGILTTIVRVKPKLINSIPDIMSTDMSVLIGNNSDLWHMYDREIGNDEHLPMDSLLKQIQPRVQFIDIENIKSVKLINGYHVNWEAIKLRQAVLTSTGKTVLKALVERGLTVRSDSRWDTSLELESVRGDDGTHVRTSDRRTDSSVRPIQFHAIQDLFTDY
ncbi:unnamed protein product, partial [Medioppia subpectinata]